MNEWLPEVSVVFLVTVVAAVAYLVGKTSGGRAETAPADPIPSIDRTDESDLLDHLSEAVLVLNEALVPVSANRPARLLLAVPGPLPAHLPVPEILSMARRTVADRSPVDEVIDLRKPRRASLKVRTSLLPNDHVVVLIRDVSEEQADKRARRQFVSHASHELKSPVASVQAIAEAIHQAAEDDPKEVQRFADKLLTETDRMARLIASLLDLSRVEDPANIPRERVHLSEIVAKEVVEAETAATSKGVHLDQRIEDDLWVKGDHQQLALMTRNLIDNALRYTEPAGSATISLQRDEDDVVLDVIDTGIGIPMSAQARVFERFFRVDEARTRDSGGTGLGLAIVKHVADLHGGHVTVRSELGEGSTFEIRLPASDPPS